MDIKYILISVIVCQFIYIAVIVHAHKKGKVRDFDFGMFSGQLLALNKIKESCDENESLNKAIDSIHERAAKVLGDDWEQWVKIVGKNLHK